MEHTIEYTLNSDGTNGLEIFQHLRKNTDLQPRQRSCETFKQRKQIPNLYSWHLISTTGSEISGNDSVLYMISIPFWYTVWNRVLLDRNQAYSPLRCTKECLRIEVTTDHSSSKITRARCAVFPAPHSWANDDEANEVCFHSVRQMNTPHRSLDCNFFKTGSQYHQKHIEYTYSPHAKTPGPPLALFSEQCPESQLRQTHLIIMNWSRTN